MNSLRTVTLNVIIVVDNVIISLVVSIAKSTAFAKAVFGSHEKTCGLLRRFLSI